MYLTRTLTLFEDMVKKKSYNNAYIFHGPIGSLVSYSGKYLAMLSICTQPTNANKPCYRCSNCVSLINETSPDFHHVTANPSISIETIRKLKERVKYGPTQDGVLFVILSQAEKLTIEASNAFLKVLEEPPEGVCFILETHFLHRLLPTITSRSQAIDFPRLSLPQLQQYVESHGLSDTLSDVSPDALPVVLPYIAEGQLPADLPLYSLTKLTGLSLPDAFKWSEQVGKNKQHIGCVLELWMHNIKDNTTLPLDVKTEIVEYLSDLYAQLPTNINFKMHLDKIISRFFELSV